MVDYATMTRAASITTKVEFFNSWCYMASQQRSNAKERQEAEAKEKEDAAVDARRNIYLFSPFKSTKITCQLNGLSHGMTNNAFVCFSDIAFLFCDLFSFVYFYVFTDRYNPLFFQRISQCNDYQIIYSF